MGSVLASTARIVPEVPPTLGVQPVDEHAHVEGEFHPGGPEMLWSPAG